MLDLNRANLSAALVNVAINDAIEQAAIRATEQPRPYLGASIVGAECLRKVQYDWWCNPLCIRRACAKSSHADIIIEARSRQQLIAAGFKFAPPEVLGFSAVDGLPARPRRRHHHCRPDPFRRVPQLPVSVGAQGGQRQEAGASSSATASRKHFRSTPHKSRSTRPISTSPTPRSSPH